MKRNHMIRKLLEKALRKYDRNTILVIGDWCEERGLVEAAKQLHKGIDSEQTLLLLEDLSRLIWKRRATQDWRPWVGVSKDDPEYMTAEELADAEVFFDYDG